MNLVKRELLLLDDKQNGGGGSDARSGQRGQARLAQTRV